MLSPTSEVQIIFSFSLSPLPCRRRRRSARVKKKGRGEKFSIPVEQKRDHSTVRWPCPRTNTSAICSQLMPMNRETGLSILFSRLVLEGMSLNERDTLIVIIVCSIVGFFSLLLIICCCFWCVIRHYRLQAKRLNTHEENESPVMASSRQHYQRSQKLPPSKVDNHYLGRKKKRRFNTNDSAITFSFDPPHLINQNVKNLDRLLNTDPTMTARSWHYEQTLPTRHW